MAVSDYLIPMIQKRQQQQQEQMQLQQQAKQKMQSDIYLTAVKEKIKGQMQAQSLKAFMGMQKDNQYEMSWSPTGISVSPISAAERVKNIEAQELLGQSGYGRQQPTISPMPQPMPQPQFPMGQPQLPVGMPQGMPRGIPQAQPQLPGGQPPTMPPMRQPQPFGGGISGLKAQQQLAQKQAEARVGAKSEIFKLSEKARANFGRSVSLFQQITSQLKGKAEEQQGLGLWPGIKGALATKTKRPGWGRTAAFTGQQRETAIGLNSILTGQNRVIRSVVKMIQETLPDEFDPQDMAASKMAQSIKNAYKLVKSFEKAGLSSSVLKKMSPNELNNINANSMVGLYTLTPGEEQEVEVIIQDVLQAPAAPKRSLPGVRGQQTKYKVLRRVR